MAEQKQQRQQANGKHAEPSKSDTPIIDKMLDHAVTYKPFMSDDDVSLTPRNVMRYFARPTRSGKTCTVEQAVRFIGLCKARALNPWEGDAFIVGFDSQDGPEFNLVTAHQAFLKRAEVHPEYDGMESGVTVVAPGGAVEDLQGDLVPDGYQIVGGWAKVHFKNRNVPMYKRLKLSTFNKNISRWKIDPAGMIVKCAEADALRSSFPTRLGGMYLREEFDAVEAQAKQRPEIAMPTATDERPKVDKPVIEDKPQHDEHCQLPDQSDADETDRTNGQLFTDAPTAQTEKV